MWLLHTGTINLQEFQENEIPPYAILSHTWEKEEVTLWDIVGSQGFEKLGYKKVSNACSVAAANGFEYIWIDTCCIDKASSAELSEAINSMYSWYKKAEICYAYLADVPNVEISESKWFTRGWTLQELIAPLTVTFLNSEWEEIGTKLSLQQQIFHATDIPIEFLLGEDPSQASVAQRMSWAANRRTSRTEDRAYCLMGIFNINMPLLYGEGERAFTRLQEEIMKISDDHTLFAWKSDENHGGLLATSPAAFLGCGDFVPFKSLNSPSVPMAISNREIRLELRLIGIGHRGMGLALLPCTEIGKEGHLVAIYLRDVSMDLQHFQRVRSEKIKMIDSNKLNLLVYPQQQIHVQQECKRDIRKQSVPEKFLLKLEQDCLDKIHAFPNWELSNTFAMIPVPTSTSTFGRLLILCRDGLWLEISLKKQRGVVLACIDINPEAQPFPTFDKSKEKHSEGDQIIMQLGDRGHLHATIKRQFMKDFGVVSAMEIKYQSPYLSREEKWLDHMVLAKDSTKKGVDPLSFATEAGLGALVKSLLAKGSFKYRLYGDGGRLVLSRAAEGGHSGVVQILLEYGVRPDAMDDNGRTPLSWAAEKGHQQLVQLLLTQRGVNVELRDNNGRTPLMYAARGGHTEVVELLLYQCKSRSDLMDKQGQTPLSHAAEGGHENLVQLLLNQRNAHADSKDIHGQTPLSYAARGGHTAVVMLLVNRGDVQADYKDITGRTPLSRAAGGGHHEVVKMLMDRNDVEINSADGNGWTALIYAVRRGYEVTVKQLLTREGIQANLKDNMGHSPLMHAATIGNEAIIRLLLARSDVHADLESNQHCALLLEAAMGGHGAGIKLLLAQKSIRKHLQYQSKATLLLRAVKGAHEEFLNLLLTATDAGALVQDRDGRTLLMHAAMHGHDGVLWLLLTRSDIGINLIDNSGRTACSLAAEAGSESIIKLLLTKGVEPDSRCVASGQDQGRTPLSFAAERGHEAVVKLFLERKVDVNSHATSERYQGRTPLSFAVENGHETVVKLLLEAGGYPNLEMGSAVEGRSPLWYAAESGKIEIARLLLEKGANPGFFSGFETKEQMPLSIAAQRGHIEVVTLLLESGVAFDHSSPLSSDKGRTPLSLAAEEGHMAVVSKLLSRGALMDSKASYKDSDKGRTPLSFAAGKGQEAVVMQLLERGAEVDSTATSDRRTPLSFAAGNGHEAVVVQLLEKGADIESKVFSYGKGNGRTPLSFAAEGGHEKVVKLLLERGAKGLTKEHLEYWKPPEGEINEGHTAVANILQSHNKANAPLRNLGNIFKG